jgi:dipeptidyl aminopeptidase/acylaminoacyl peptidase
VSGPVEAPFGTWPSPIDADAVARAATLVSGVRLDGESAWWLESRPAEGGRTALVRSDPWSDPVDVTPEGFDVRTLVHEYGGGPFAVRDSTVYFSNLEDQRLYRQQPGGAPEPITPEPPEPRSVRYADADVSPDGRWLVCVRERHQARGVTNELVLLPTDGTAEPLVVADGSDFFSFPRFSPAGDRIAWLRWDLPRMPWDGTELLVAAFRDGELGVPALTAGGPNESVFQPAWSPAGTLHFVSDRTGWWNLYRLEPDGAATNLSPMAAEFGVPAWEFGYSSYAFLDDGRIACAYRRSGEQHLAMLDPSTSELIDVDVPHTSFSPPYVSASGSRIAFVGASPTSTREVVVLDFTSRAVDVLRPGEGLGVDDAFVSVAEPIEFATDGGATAYAYYYPPHNPGYRAPEGELPPLVVRAHGGPTSEATPELKPYVQYFTSRGFAFADVNYGGSTGYGREFRERLYGRWGDVDVGDCVAAARHLAASGRADPDRLVVTGGSAGGYVVLAAMAFRPDAFAAGTSQFGVSDIASLASATHKFESRYLDSLLAPELWRERSPLYSADAIDRPLLLLQGLEDAVVPPAQAEAMIEALRDRGVPYAYLAFEGEQHGFRRADSIVRALQAELAFYGQILGFDPADHLPTLEIAGRG